MRSHLWASEQARSLPTDWVPRILIAEPGDFPEEASHQLSQVGSLQSGRTVDGPLALEFEHFDVVFTRLASRVETVPIPPSTNPRILVSPTTGLDHIDLDWCGDNGIEVVSLAGEAEFLRTIRGTAEHSLALTLALLRNLVGAVESVREGEWNRDDFRGREISGSTVGIVGVGRIGTMMAAIFNDLGASVIGYDSGSVVFPDELGRVHSLHELLGASDIVTLHANYRRGQAPIMGQEEFARMRPGAVLINTARGGLIDEGALIGALETGRLGGAALDVVEGEPDVARRDIVEASRRLPNLIITPHVGGNTYESRERVELRMTERVIQLLGRPTGTLRGEPC